MTQYDQMDIIGKNCRFLQGKNSSKVKIKKKNE